jgi:cupin fold WbuC family metalloprotein
MKLFSQDILDELSAKAAASPRLRAHYNIHASGTDPVQRFFVVAQRDTYFRPHRHQTRSELALVLRGQFDVLTFDERGSLTARYTVGCGTPNFAYETPRGTWHTLLAVTDGSTFLEVKEGPYDPAVAAEFAAWAPPEGHESVPGFLDRLRGLQVGGAAHAGQPYPK